MAREVLFDYMRVTPQEEVVDEQPPQQVLLADSPEGLNPRHYVGVVGSGVRYRLAWKFIMRVHGSRGTWIGAVDAATGKVVLFSSTLSSAQVKGGVYPRSNDGNCPNGCEQDGYPMPYADVITQTGPVYANALGVFECSDTEEIMTTLTGDYVTMIDHCGPLDNETAPSCYDDLDLGSNAFGTDCAVSPGASAGNTHATRTAYYHVNRVLEKARGWLPSVEWQEITAEVNSDPPRCNASAIVDRLWFHKQKLEDGCRNGGENPSVIHHETGHALDRQEPPVDLPQEAYADAVAILQGRDSCIARGWFDDPCDGCVSCTGRREMNYRERTPAEPAGPDNWIPNCQDCAVPPGCSLAPGPCGRNQYCEMHLPLEAVWDLATEDLPKLGLDEQSAWQLTEKFFYMSAGLGGQIYDCSEDTTTGCSPTSWYTRFITLDDNHGDLFDGTPHMSAIFDAFDRHGVACPSPVPQNSTCCPAPSKPSPSIAVGVESNTLTWNHLYYVDEYLVLRNDFSCDDYSFNIIDRVTPDEGLPAGETITWVDTDVPDGFPLYYRIQAVHTFPGEPPCVCDSLVSDCVRTCPPCEPWEECVPSDNGQCHVTCPATNSCGDWPCSTAIPRECTEWDTGHYACAQEGELVFVCDPGQTLIVNHCACSEPPGFCPDESTFFVCEGPVCASRAHPCTHFPGASEGSCECTIVDTNESCTVCGQFPPQFGEIHEYTCEVCTNECPPPPIICEPEPACSTWHVQRCATN
jgi:hypothetical protein